MTLEGLPLTMLIPKGVNQQSTWEGSTDFGVDCQLTPLHVDLGMINRLRAKFFTFQQNCKQLDPGKVLVDSYLHISFALCIKIEIHQETAVLGDHHRRGHFLLCKREQCLPFPVGRGDARS